MLLIKIYTKIVKIKCKGWFVVFVMRVTHLENELIEQAQQTLWSRDFCMHACKDIEIRLVELKNSQYEIMFSS